MGDSWSNREVSGIQAILVVAALVIVGLGFVVSLMLINDYSRDHWVPAAIWVRLALFSTITLAAMIVEFKSRWKRVRFWFALAGLMLARTAIYVAVLKQAPDWPLDDVQRQVGLVGPEGGARPELPEPEEGAEATQRSRQEPRSTGAHARRHARRATGRSSRRA